MTNYLPKGNNGSKEISGENIYFTREQQKQGGVRSASKGTEIDWGNSQEGDGVSFHCGYAGHTISY